MVEKKNLELLQFDKIKDLVKQKCHGRQAKALCDSITPGSDLRQISVELNRVNELKVVFTANGYLPSVEYDDIQSDLDYLALEGSLLQESQLLSVLKTI